MALKPEMSIAAALATGVAVYGVYQVNMPSVADVRAVESGNADVQATERLSTWESAVLVAGISLIARDPSIFIVGSAITVALAWKYRHADMVSPLTHKATAALTVDQVVAAQEPAAAPSTDSGYGGGAI